MITKKYIITGKRFSGQVVLGYDQDSFLRLLDATEAQMTSKQLHYLLAHLPRTESKLEALVQQANGMKLTKVPIAIDFDSFWEAYGKKVNRKRCEPLWAKLSDAKRSACMMSLEPYANFLRRNEGRAKLDPENYLKRYAFENDWNAL